MQAKRSAAIREEWGDKPCDHPTMAKEYAGGRRTGDYLCTQCGAKVTFQERVELLASRNR